MRDVGPVEEGRLSIPLTQEVLGDVLGLTPVTSTGFDPGHLHSRRRAGS